MKKFSHWMNLIIGLLLILVLSFDSQARSTASKKVQLVELTTQIEKLISSGYREKISTQIDPTLFRVGTIVTLREVVETYNAKKSGATLSAVRNMSETIRPSDLSTGVIQLYPVLDHYKKQIDELQSKVEVLKRSDPTVVGESSDVKKPKYLVSGVEVIVGLDDGLKPDQIQEFEVWLKTQVKKDFGSRGKYKISTFQKLVKIQEPPKVLTPFEKLSRIQVLLGSGFLGVFALFLLILWKFIPSRDSKHNGNMTLQIQEVQGSSLPTPERRASSPTPQSPKASKKKEPMEEPTAVHVVDHLEVIAQSCREIQGKIGYLYLSTPGIITPLFETWYDHGSVGRLKAAALVDAVLTSAENTEQKLLVFPEKWRKDEELHHAFRAFPSLSIEERHKILDEAYWDILSLNMLGQDSLKSHFEVLAHLPTETLHRLLSNRDHKAKALTLMHLPSEKAQDYLNILDQEERRRLIHDSLQFESVAEEELKTLDESLKLQLAVEQKAEGLVNVIDLIPNILRSLTPKEELEWLTEAVEQLPDRGFKLKRNYPSLAFIKEWPDEALAIFFAGLDSKLAVAYLKATPSMIDKVVALYPSAMGQVIRDEAISKRGPNEKELIKSFQQLKDRLLQLTQNGDIHLERIFRQAPEETPSTPTDEGSVAA